MGNIKLFVCCHQPFSVPRHPLLVPIQVGSVLADSRFPGFVHDDNGENISGKNRSYCELTAQYWAWKNEQADYYGFFHYRRYLYPDADAALTYRIEEKPTDALLEQLGYEAFAQMIENYDLLLPKSEEMHVAVRRHYADAPHHRENDLALVEKIVAERHPEMCAAMDEYLNGTRHYFGNMYIMKREVFSDYCAWLFPILEEFDRRADKTGYSTQELRVDGYLAERLFGVYYTANKERLSFLELPRVHFVPDEAVRRKQKLINALLPPGSRRRAFVKQMKGK